MVCELVCVSVEWPRGCVTMNTICNLSRSFFGSASSLFKSLHNYKKKWVLQNLHFIIKYYTHQHIAIICDACSNVSHNKCACVEAYIKLLCERRNVYV